MAQIYTEKRWIMKYIVNRVEMFDASDKKTIINKMNEPTDNIEKFRKEISTKYGSKRVLLVYRNL